MSARFCVMLKHQSGKTVLAVPRECSYVDAYIELAILRRAHRQHKFFVTPATRTLRRRLAKLRSASHA